MAVNTDKVKSLLGLGLSQEQVASAVGCTVSFISQLMSEESFSQEVVEKRTEALQAATSRDLLTDGIEDALISKLKNSLDMIYKPRDILHAFATVNRAVRRGIQQTAAPVQQTTVVTLQIPTQIVQRFTMSATKEVIQVDDQTLVTMNSTTLLRDLQKSATHERYAEVARFLPSQHLPESKLLTEEHGFGGDRKSRNFQLRKQEREELRSQQTEGS